ncbi:MAG: hypothetical protein RIB93_00980 [Coleofasciculus sp. D1-CHI-01]|uniref:hypothetical protein n=1 Tax=Coleofasciculus sp. D1-CHI-01 TaxID=3068482 RepID=UPI0033008DF1
MNNYPCYSAQLLPRIRHTPNHWFGNHDSQEISVVPATNAAKTNPSPASPVTTTLDPLLSQRILITTE